MSRLLRVLALFLLVGGLLASAMAIQAALTDDAYFRAAAALERGHYDNVYFQAEYQATLARHVAFLVAAAVSAVAGVVGGAVLFALATILGRLHRLEAGAAR